MKEFYKGSKRLFVAFLSALLIITQLGIFSPETAYAQETGSDNSQTAEVKATKADGTTVLTFTSDIHNQSNNTAANRLGDWLTKVRNQYGAIESMNFCGDMGAAQGNGNTWWGYVQSVMDVVDSKGIPGVYTTGNHEFMNGSFTPTANAQARKYVVGDVGREGDNYVIYCLGTDNWNNNQDNFTTGQVDKLKAFLNSRNTDKPIIVLVHFPLHTCSGGNSGWGGMGGRTTQNADLVIDALNAGAAKGQKIILLWGHNHTMSDSLYDQVFVPNDQIEYKSGSKKTIGFYYGAAGCMSDSEYGSGSAYVKGKGLVLTIDNEDKITMTYLNANGNDVTEGGAFKEDGSVTPYNPGDQDDPPTGDTVNITPTTDNPEESIKINVGDTLDIKVTNGSSSNAYDFTATVGNSSIAQIQGNSTANIAAGGTATFTIKGLAQGTVDINIQNTNQYGSQYVRKGVVHVTVGEGGSTPVDPQTGDTVDITPTTDNPEESISVKVGDTFTINATNGSSNSAYDFTATVGDSSIAQIQGNSTINIGMGATGKFTVKGLAKGTTDITIQNENQYGSQYVRKGVVHVTVTDDGSIPVDPPTPVGENNYKLTDQFTSGKTYLIVDRNSTGSGHALSNPGGTSSGANLGTANVTVQSGDVDGDGKSDIYVSTESSNIIWTVTANDAKFNITNGSDYLEGYHGNVAIFNMQNYPDRGWNYNSNQLQHTGGDNVYTVYYSNGFTGTYNSVSDKVYLYEKVDYVEPHEHTWDDGVETTPATCTEAGVKTFTCTGCGETRTETIEALGHDWEETVKEATCTEAGEKTTTCKRCGETTTEEIPVLGHDWNDWQIRKEATCDEAGTKYRICKNCGGIESEQIPALGHEYQEVEGSAKAATCTDAGKEADKKCTRCGKEETGTEIPALRHDWSAWETRIEPTETAKGLKIRHCSRCDKIETEDIPMITPSKPDDTPTPTPTPDSKDEPKKEESKSTVPTKIPAEISPTNPVSAAAVDKQILNAKTDGDPKGSVFNLLQAKGVAKSKTSVKVSWKKVTGAKKYIVYGNKCGTKYRFKKIKEVKGTSFTQKGLKKGTYYKYLIVAVNGNKALATSKGIHVATKGGKIGNSKSVTTKAKKNKVTLKKGKTFKLGAKAVAENKKLKVKKHRAIAYESGNKKVATISKKGVIKGVKKGTCYVYAYAQNGVCKKIKVTVK